MAVSIINQPATNSIVAAYRPILFLLNCNQQPANGNPCPIVIADVYINGVYQSSISVTDYDTVTIWIFTIYQYTFDIQDIVQQYLNSKFTRMYETTNGDMEDARVEAFSCAVRVVFREGYIDANGFTNFYGTAPVAGTKYTSPVAGTGTATSNTFYALNATLTHEDNPSLGLHLDDYKDSFQSTYTLSHRPNLMPNFSKQVAGGKYYVTRLDNDFIFFFSNNSLSSGWLIYIAGKYTNGQAFNSSPVSPGYPTTTTTPATYKVYSFNAGIPNLRKLFGNINWDRVLEYEVYIVSAFFQAIRQYYFVEQTSCNEYARVFFLNNLGTYDGINFERVTIVNKSQSDISVTSLPGMSAPAYKGYHHINRRQVTQNDYYEAECSSYGEQDMNWIKELLGSPRAYLQWSGIQGQNNGLLPIVIEDSDVITRKKEGRYEYVLIIKFYLSNDRFNLRN